MLTIITGATPLAGNVFFDTIKDIGLSTAFVNIGVREIIMLLLSFVMMYLAIVKDVEPLLMIPIAFGMALTNIPGANVFHPDFFLTKPVDFGMVLNEGGLLDIVYIGIKTQIFPPLIFLGIGCMTDFGPLIANPKSFLLGAAAQAGIFLPFLGACLLGLVGWEPINYTFKEAASIAIIGGADGPTAIWLTTKLAPHMLGSIAVAAYSYMALVPVIQPPIMKALTTKKERSVKMEQLRFVSQREKIIFPIVVTIIVAFIVPAAAPLIGMLMFGNLLKESGKVDRLVKTAQNELMNIVTIFLGVTVGSTATAGNFLTLKTLCIVALGLIAFSTGTACGVIFGKIMYLVTGGKVNPLIGSAGVSAVPMAARVSQRVGAETDPTNFLLMHAMGPNVAGVIGSAVAAGVLFSIFGG